MVWEPAIKALVANTAFPALSTAALPRMIGPSLKVTVPLGIPLPPPLADTTAVKATDWPKQIGLGALVRVVTVGLVFTAWTTDPV